MSKSRTIGFSTCLVMLFLLVHCGGGGTGPVGQGGTATGGSSSTGGGISAGGGTSMGGGSGGAAAGTSAGGAKSTGGAISAGGTLSAGGTASSGGTLATGGTLSAGGTKAMGGTLAAGGTKGMGGTTSSGGTSAGGAMPAGGTMSSGGTTSTGGMTSAGGTTSMGGTTSTGGTTAATTDCNHQALAKPGDSTITSTKYLNLGDMRLIDNRWGSDALGCSGTYMKVSVSLDKSIGYEFNRPACGGKKAYPDFPEIEFGVAPFGKDSSLRTSPACSSTSLLPIQIRNLTSATLNIDNFSSTYQNGTYYDTNFEFWISKNDPRIGDGGVYAEVIAFLGWNGDRMSSPNGWPCDVSGSVNGYNLCHQSDTWSSGWRFFNFNLGNGPQSTFSGKVDIKAMLDWIVSNWANPKKGSLGSFTTDMWLTRIEVGTEVDDNTSGTAKINNLTFEVNGTKKSIELAQ